MLRTSGKVHASHLLADLAALSERLSIHKGLSPALPCWECQRRYKSKGKQRPFTMREDDLIQRALDEEFGSANMCVPAAACLP